MPVVRVMLNPMPGLYRGLVEEAIAAQPDILITDDGTDARTSVAGADVVLVCSTGPVGVAEHRRALTGRPGCGLVVWDPTDPEGTVLDLHVHDAPGLSWQQRLIESIRACASRGGAP